MIEVMYVTRMQIRLNMQFVYGVLYRGNCCVTSHKNADLYILIECILYFYSLGTLLKFLEFCLRITNPFAKYYPTNQVRHNNMKVEFFFVNPWNYIRFINTSGITIPINSL